VRRFFERAANPNLAPLAQVAAWSNHHQPERRVDFWTNPEAELDLAADAGVKVLRLGVDWGRIIPWVS
jgi:beta-glucosidase/6-phospho-beta-glucosidase/beta-galactosidase